MRQVTYAAILTAALFSTSAMADTFSTGSAHVESIGAQFSTVYDKLDFVGTSNTFTSGVSTSIGSLYFLAGPNCYTCTPVSGATSFSFDVNGVSQTVDLNYQWSSTGSTDFIAFNLSNLSFESGGNLVNVVFATPGVLSSTGGSASENLFATITVSAVPEPETNALMLAGLGLLAGIARRRKTAKA